MAQRKIRRSSSKAVWNHRRLIPARIADVVIQWIEAAVRIILCLAGLALLLLTILTVLQAKLPSDPSQSDPKQARPPTERKSETLWPLVHPFISWR